MGIDTEWIVTVDQIEKIFEDLGECNIILEGAITALRNDLIKKAFPIIEVLSYFFFLFFL
jgi:hypothetical protein